MLRQYTKKDPHNTSIHRYASIENNHYYVENKIGLINQLMHYLKLVEYEIHNGSVYTEYLNKTRMNIFQFLELIQQKQDPVTLVGMEKYDYLNIKYSCMNHIPSIAVQTLEIDLYSTYTLIKQIYSSSIDNHIKQKIDNELHRIVIDFNSIKQKPAIQQINNLRHRLDTFYWYVLGMVGDVKYYGKSSL